MQLKFVTANNLCNYKQVHSGLTWAIAQIVVDNLNPIVK
jgi:hypothetical protein